MRDREGRSRKELKTKMPLFLQLLACLATKTENNAAITLFLMLRKHIYLYCTQQNSQNADVVRRLARLDNNGVIPNMSH